MSRLIACIPFLSQVRLLRAHKPYGGCAEIDAEQNKQLNLWSVFGYNYTTETCHYTYTQYVISNTCGCLDERYPVPEDRKNLSLCNFAQFFCKLMTGNFVYHNLPSTDECPLLCKEPLFETIVSTHGWPSRASAQYITNKYDIFQNSTLDEIRENLLKVSIYFQNTRVKTIYETPMLGIFDLLADIGGHLGLWVGLSLLAVCELLEIAFDFTWSLFHWSH